MKGRPPANLPASIHQHLLNLRDQTGADFNQLLTRYTLERLLYRLSQSPYADQFILKGALLFATWTRHFHRPTQDLDLLGQGDASAENVQAVFRHICQTEVEPDGLVFDPDSITIQQIKEGQTYESQRVHLLAHLGQANIQVQIDIGYGDVVTPVVQKVNYPALLHLSAPQVNAYPPETVVAEKLQAMVALGMQNSRMKDFYDLWLMARDLSFDGEVLVEAIRATFDRRKTNIPDDTPTALSEAFASEGNKTTQWQAFLNRSGLEDAPTALSATLDSLRMFILPPLHAASSRATYEKSWQPGGPWL